MCTVRSLTVSRSIPCIGEGVCSHPRECRPLPLDADPPDVDSWDVDPLDADPTGDRITDTCEKITLPQTSFADGNDAYIYGRIFTPFFSVFAAR